jgi:hypothetical protein
MQRPECVITGCALVAQNEGKWMWGDLHRIGDSFVLNGSSLAPWEYGDLPNASLKTVYVDSNEYFERRGVAVFHKDAATFNDAAKEHMA